MSSVSATTKQSSTSTRQERRRRPRLLFPALAIGAAWGIALTIVSVGFTTTDDGHPYRHAADYWLTGLGLPLVLSAIVVVHSARGLVEGRDGWRGRWGAYLFVVPALIFAAIFVDGLVESESSSWGPTYLLCVFTTDVFVGLFISGLWRTMLAPRWVLVLWWLGWFIGGPLAPGPAPLLHTAAYAVLAVHIRRRLQNL